MNKLIAERLSNLNWFNNSEENIQETLLNCPESFDNFLFELSNRKDIAGNIEIIRLIAISFGNHFALPVFEVKDTKSGKIFEYEFIGRKRGTKHSVRGLVMIEKDGELQYFVTRKSWRFAIDSTINESIGSIYEPDDNSRLDKFKFKNYIENALSEQLGEEDVIFERFYDLGWLYPDVGMTHHKVSIFAAVLSSDRIDWDTIFTSKIINQKNYEFQYELIPVNNLLSYLAATNDSHLLAIFGRLQALNVIKL